MVEKVNNWLDQQEGKFSGDRPSQVNMLQQNLDFGALEIQELYAGEKLIVVPVRTGFVTETNKQLNPVQYALFILDAKQSIRKGNIVQFVADATYPSKNLPANFFHNYYNLKETGISGKIAFLNVAGDFQYETKYAKGNVISNSVIQRKANTVSTGGGPVTEACYDVWYVTWYTNGTSNWEYLFSFCNGENGELPCKGTISASGRDLQVECGGGGSGPGGGGGLAEVINLLTTPCKNAALGAVTQSGINNLISNFYNNSILPSTAPLTVIFNETNISTLGVTTPLVANTIFSISLSNLPNIQNNMSQEAWGAVIAHELLHVYLMSPGVNTTIQNEPQQHWTIFFQFVNTISSLLQSSFSLSPQVATQLALNGVDDLWTYGNFDQMSQTLYGYTRSQFQATFANYTTGGAGTRCP